MSPIQHKKGQCKDCPKGSLTYLIAGRCQTHYWRYRASLKKFTRPVENKNQAKKELDKWFLEQISQMPKCCENCGDYLNPYAPWGAKAYIAHIVPKRHFKSVRTHPVNRVFLCIQCHTNFDNWPERKVMLMPVFQTVCERYSVFADLIPEDEQRYLPEYFKILIEKAS